MPMMVAAIILVVITRDRRDLIVGELPVESPDEYLAWLELRGL